MKRTLILVCFLLILNHCHDEKDARVKIISSSVESNSDRGKNKKLPDRNILIAQKEFVKKPKRHKNQKKISQKTDQQSVFSNSIPSRDSLLLVKMRYLQSTGIELDLNEPNVKKFLNSTISPLKFPPVLTISRERFLKVNFDNDILDYTDRFYTNGIRIDLISPVFSDNPASKVLLPYWSSGTNHYGLSLVQNMYTPSTTKTGGILYNDRPYAAYLYLGSFKISNDPVHKFRQTSELDLGIIGPYSFGEWVQRSFHNSVPTNNEPLGWEYQIQNDAVLNYNVTLEKGIWNTRSVDFNLVSAASIGTLYTNVGGGFLFRIGWLNPYFTNLGISKGSILKRTGLKKFQFIFFFKGSGKLVGYDATLEGGMINRSSVYTLGIDQITRMVFMTSAGFSLSYNGFRIDAEQFLLSPEFKYGLWHKWVHIGLSFCM